METGKAQSIRDLAKKREPDGCLCRAGDDASLSWPDIIETILNGTQPRMLRLGHLSKIRNIDREEQKNLILGKDTPASLRR